MSFLTQEQKSIIKSIVKDINLGNKQFVTLGGYAGTGKSTIIKVILDALARKKMSFSPCAYTGKAANILRKKRINAATIHSIIYTPFVSENNEVFWDLVNKESLRGEISGFIIDESSMVSKEIHEDLISFGLPVIYVGDHGQLEPIGTSFNLMKDPDYKLETVHRNAGEIAHFAQHLRMGKNCLLFKPEKKVQIVDFSAIQDKHLVSFDQVICAFNKTRVQINERARKEKGIELTYVSVGEKVICLKNNKRNNLFNGMQGVVTRIGKKDTFDFISDGVLYEKIKYDPDQFGKESNSFDYSESVIPFDYSYCITCHKAQGDQFNSVIVYEQKCDKWNHSRWSYTAASRAINNLVWCSSSSFLPNYI